MKTIKATGQARLFQSPILEALTKTSPTLTLLTYIPVIAVSLFLYFSNNSGQVIYGISLFAGGFLFWTFFEYIMHRFIFHLVSENKYAKRLNYLIHGVHHEYPRDSDRLFMPPVPGLFILSIIYGTAYLTGGEYSLAFVPGLVSGYLLYSFMHYSIHTVQPPKVLRGLWKHHNLHHYKHQDRAFGVSSPLWDYVFGTMPPRDPKGSTHNS